MEARECKPRGVQRTKIDVATTWHRRWPDQTDAIHTGDPLLDLRTLRLKVGMQAPD